MRLSVVVPVLNEAPTLRARLSDFDALAAQSELIFVDGGSRDDTLSILRDRGYRAISSPAGRALQMNTGASHATCEWLLFLHADTRLPISFCANKLASLNPSWGFFCLRFDNSGLPFRFIAEGINRRARWTRIASGDQAIFVRREVFDAVGGYPPIDLMEDIALSRTLRRLSPPIIIEDRVTTSARRWETRGLLRTQLQMWGLQIAYRLGVPTSTLDRWYRSL